MENLVLVQVGHATNLVRESDNVDNGPIASLGGPTNMRAYTLLGPVLHLQYTHVHTPCFVSLKASDYLFALHRHVITSKTLDFLPICIHFMLRPTCTIVVRRDHVDG